MAKIVVTGAGSAQSNGVINSLLMDEERNEIIGFGSNPYDLMLCRAHKKYLVPHSTDANYKKVLLDLLAEIKPDMIHFQHDLELFIAVEFQEEIEKLGVKLFLPEAETINLCVHKYLSWKKFQEAGIRVPQNIVIDNTDDLKRAFTELNSMNNSIWLRSLSIGGGGKGSLPTNDYEEACQWIDKHDGWGSFVAAELLSEETVTWMSIWYEGELVVAQGRKRLSWAHSSLSPSGVTGMTKVGETVSIPMVDEIGKAACYAVSQKPHGIYAVDMAYDFEGIPNPTEINIGRFFTTVQFFAEAGLNLPVIYKNLCLYGSYPQDVKILNPLPDGLLWLRAMDSEPRLVTNDDIEKELIIKL